MHKKVTLLLLVSLLSVQSCSDSPMTVGEYMALMNEYTVARYNESQQAKKVKSAPKPYVKPKKIAKPRSVNVRKGDQLFEIANRYSVPSREIIEINKLKPPYKLLIGQKLILPTTYFHNVKKGESLFQISRQYSVDVRNLVKANGLHEPFVIKVGEKIRIPYKNYAEIHKPNKSAKNIKPKKSTVKRLVSKPKQPTLNTKSYNRKDARKISRPISSKTFSAKGKGPKRFYWPIKGKIISKFGNKGDGVSNEGINIAAKEGANIKAAASGVVVYTGSELKGYGNLLIIRHGGGWLTAYAHQKEILVSKGTIVKRGQVIGNVGKSGKVKIPQLHFSIRKGRKAIDPLRILKG